jgi:hypothetical protein
MSVQVWGAQQLTPEEITEEKENSTEENDALDSFELVCQEGGLVLRCDFGAKNKYLSLVQFQSDHFFEIPSPPPEIV